MLKHKFGMTVDSDDLYNKLRFNINTQCVTIMEVLTEINFYFIIFIVCFNYAIFTNY